MPYSPLQRTDTNSWLIVTEGLALVVQDKGKYLDKLLERLLSSNNSAMPKNSQVGHTDCYIPK